MLQGKCPMSYTVYEELSKMMERSILTSSQNTSHLEWPLPIHKEGSAKTFHKDYNNN